MFLYLRFFYTTLLLLFSCLLLPLISLLLFPCAMILWDTHLVYGVPVPYNPCYMVFCISRRNGLTAEVLLSIDCWVDHKTECMIEFSLASRRICLSNPREIFICWPVCISFPFASGPFKKFAITVYYDHFHLQWHVVTTWLEHKWRI